ncbi:Avirulence (Avh) protein [Phytophthora megakarya]|uniref:RxLR effector protein n=1 Tax=Phytophthora megakarya TaxID=4795 RepID=A0A225WXP5_9STRA|nr:Avirulence (Avh) protein [Phytophthora megakarya]
MRLSQFLLLMVVSFVGCLICTTTATNDVSRASQTLRHNNEHARESRRYLKNGEKATNSMSAEDEERMVSFKQYLGVFKFPKIFPKLSGASQLKWLRGKFGNKAGGVFNAWYKYRMSRPNAQI